MQEEEEEEDHVYQVIFADHELCTIQGLLADYRRIISNFSHANAIKSGHLKELRVKEF